MQCNAIQYDTIQYNIIQTNTIKYNTIQFNIFQCSAVQCKAVQCSAVQSQDKKDKTRQGNETIQYSAVQCNAVQYIVNNHPMTKNKPSPFIGLRSERDKSLYFGHGVVIYFIMQCNHYSKKRSKHLPCFPSKR